MGEGAKGASGHDISGTGGGSLVERIDRSDVHDEALGKGQALVSRQPVGRVGKGSSGRRSLP